MQRRARPDPINVPKEKPTSYTLTNQGRFTEGDLTISREGLLINSPASTLHGPRPDSSSSERGADDSASSRGPGEPSTSGSELSPDDLEEVAVIGSGSSGVAKKVRNRRTGQLLVLKVINFDVSSDTIRKQITTELRTLYGALHDNVVRYNQAFFDNGAITICMEYMDAGSLADLLRSIRPIPEQYIAAIARQTVAGLQYLHKELHIVHRDIKPSNLLLNRKGELKISDFGVSGQLTSSVSNCLSWVGTVTYMSPERIKGESYSYDSDFWSLGLTLVECALGRFPYPPPGEAPVQLGFWELLEYIVMESPPQLSRSEFSPEFVDFVCKCLQKDAATRPSIDALARHAFLRMHKGVNLGDLVTGGGSKEAPSSAQGRASKDGAPASSDLPEGLSSSSPQQQHQHVHSPTAGVCPSDEAAAAGSGLQAIVQSAQQQQQLAIQAEEAESGPPVASAAAAIAVMAAVGAV